MCFDQSSKISLVVVIVVYLTLDLYIDSANIHYISYCNL